MSFSDRLVLWLHVGFAIFTIGPITAAVMSTPRYIRKRNLVVVRYLFRTTRLYAIFCLGVLIFGLVLAQQLHDFSKPWLTVSLTLFVVALALLALILRDQHRAIVALVDAEETAAEVAASVPGAAGQPAAAAGDGGVADGPDPVPVSAGPPVTAGSHLAHVERGRIATMGGVVGAIWLVTLVLMVWNG